MGFSSSEPQYDVGNREEDFGLAELRTSFVRPDEDVQNSLVILVSFLVVVHDVSGVNSIVESCEVLEDVVFLCIGDSL